MTTKTATKFIWKSLEPSKTAGWCVICEGVVPSGVPIVILATGPRKDDWAKSHKDCAVGNPDVLEQPDNIRQIEAAQTVEPIRKALAPRPHSPLKPIVEPITGAGATRYRVALGDRTIFTSSNRSRAEGARDLAEQLLKDGEISI